MVWLVLSPILEVARARDMDLGASRQTGRGESRLAWTDPTVSWVGRLYRYKCPAKVRTYQPSGSCVLTGNSGTALSVDLGRPRFFLGGSPVVSEAGPGDKL